MCDMFHEVMKDVWVRLGDLRTENGDLKRTVKELAGLVAKHETGEAPGDWGADFTKTATAGSVSVDAAADGRAIGSPSLARCVLRPPLPPPLSAESIQRRSAVLRLRESGDRGGASGVSKWSCLAAAGGAPRVGQPGWACGHTLASPVLPLKGAGRVSG